MSNIPEESIAVFVKGFHKQAIDYGFDKVDIVRFVNLLLDLSMRDEPGQNQPAEASTLSTKQVKPKMHELPIKGEHVILSKMDCEKHLSMIQEWVSTDNGSQFLLSRASAQLQSFEQLSKRDDCEFAMISTIKNEFIGCVAYLNIDDQQKKAEIRKLIGVTQMRGRGLAKEATRLWVEYGLGTLGLRKIHLSTLDTNIPNVKLNQDLGFKVEGVLRKEIFFNGEYRDLLRMALWKD